MTAEEIKKVLYLISFVIFACYLILHNKGITGISHKEEILRSIALLKNHVKRKGVYKLPLELEKELYKKRKTDNKLLTNIAYDILKFCGVHPANLQVKTYRELSRANTAGQYIINNYQSTIKIKITPMIGPNEIMAILIHECMHFYINSRGLRRYNKEENEILTNVATVYLGFYEYMILGYNNIGYLKKSELRYTKNQIENS